MLMAYNLYKEDISSIYDPATGIEVYHNHTLLHDDLMDRSRICVGESRLCIKSGTIILLFLSGDTMLILAFRYIAGCAPEHLKEVVDLFSLTALEI